MEPNKNYMTRTNPSIDYVKASTNSGLSKMYAPFINKMTNDLKKTKRYLELAELNEAINEIERAYISFM